MADSSERPGLFRRLLGGGADEEKVRTVLLPLQAYGKLPIYKDFISIGLTDAGSREFRHWLDRGFSYRWSEKEDYRDTEIPSHGFLLRLPESKTCVAGTLWGSSDEGGLRRFPFAVFLSFPAAQPAADPFAAVNYLAALERRCEEIREGYAAGASLSAFYKAYRGAQFECSLKTREQAYKELKSAIGGFLVSEFAESLFGARAAACWPAFLASLEDAAGQTNGPGAIRLPLSGVLPRSREITVWLRWLERLDAKRRRPVTGVLYNGGRGPGRAVLFFRELAPEDFLLLHPARGSHAQVRDVGPPEEEPPAPASSPPADPPAPEVPAAAADVPPAPAGADAAPSEALPFPEAQAPETGPAPGPRETFSALEVPVAGAPAPESAGQSGPGTAPSADAATPLPAPEPQPPAPSPAGWERPLLVLLGL